MITTTGITAILLLVCVVQFAASDAVRGNKRKSELSRHVRARNPASESHRSQKTLDPGSKSSSGSSKSSDKSPKLGKSRHHSDESSKSGKSGGGSDKVGKVGKSKKSDGGGFVRSNKGDVILTYLRKVNTGTLVDEGDRPDWEYHTNAAANDWWHDADADDKKTGAAKYVPATVHVTEDFLDKRAGLRRRSV